MRAYHYVCEHFGKENLRKRHLKVSRKQSLNDPFEFLSVSLADPNVRRVLHNNKLTLSSTMGLLCFSETWRSPLMWAHYADKHHGICLGFDIPEDRIHPVRYISRRVMPPEPLEKVTPEFVQGLFLRSSLTGNTNENTGPSFGFLDARNTTVSISHRSPRSLFSSK